MKDTEHWLASPKREEVFGALGVGNIRTFVSPDDPTKVAVQHDGVLPETLVLLVEQRSA